MATNQHLYAIWQDREVRGYIVLTEGQRDRINALPDAGLYIGHDEYTNPAAYRHQRQREEEEYRNRHRNRALESMRAGFETGGVQE